MNGGEGRKVVCVTGASGYIASWLVKLLLLRGYTVKASVRDLSLNGDGSAKENPKKTEHLLAFEGAKERLFLFEANLLEDGSFDSAVDGCEGVFHTASPCTYYYKDPKAELVDPAVKGTLNVLSSCAKVPTLRRVILTSSMAAMVYNSRRQIPGVVVDETWFSDEEFMENSKLWYPLSKTWAENAAWKFVREKGIDMVVMHPAVTVGPLLQPTLNESASLVLQLISGAKTYPNLAFGWVHVKDVANAHIRAFEIPSANGRYCLVERGAHYSEIVKILKELFPTLQLPDRCEDDKPFVAAYRASTEKAKSLGIDFIPIDVAMKETVESLKEKKLL